MEAGVVLKGQGVRGELKIKPLTDDPARFLKLKSVFIDGREYPIRHIAVRAGYVFLSLEGVEDKEAADALRDKYVEVADKDRVKLKKGSYFISDLIGCQVFAGDKPVGTVTEVFDNGAAPVFRTELDGVRCMFPFLKKLLAVVDIQTKTVRVDPAVFSEVAVIED